MGDDRSVPPWVPADTVLFRLRGLPPTALNLEGLNPLHFKTLPEEPPGFAKAIWSFEIEVLTPTRCTIRTMTRVHCIDDTARRVIDATGDLSDPSVG